MTVVLVLCIFAALSRAPRMKMLHLSAAHELEKAELQQQLKGFARDVLSPRTLAVETPSALLHEWPLRFLAVANLLLASCFHQRLCSHVLPLSYIGSHRRSHRRLPRRTAHHLIRRHRLSHPPQSVPPHTTDLPV